jgi:hypothetical protein
MLAKRTMNIAAESYAKVFAIRGSARQLEILRARRSAVQALIESLEDYERFCSQQCEPPELRTA